MDMKSKDRFRKGDPFFVRFRERAQEALIPGKDVAIDKLLIQAMGQFLHTFQIPNKAAGNGYKVYALCVFGYLWNFVFTSRTKKIAEIQKVRKERLTFIMIKQIIHSLHYRGERRVLWIDNFFYHRNPFR